MNSRHIEYSRAHVRSLSSTTHHSARSGRTSRDASTAARRTERSPMTPLSTFSDDARRDRFTNDRYSDLEASSDDEPMFHMELTPPPASPPATLRTSCALPLFSNPYAMYHCAADILGRPFKLHAMGTCTTFAPKWPNGTAPKHPSPPPIEIVELFGCYQPGSPAERTPLPPRIERLNATLRGVTSLALLLLHSTGQLRPEDSDRLILARAEAFAVEVRKHQGPAAAAAPRMPLASSLLPRNTALFGR